MEIKRLTQNNIPQILELESKHAPEKPLYAKYDTEALTFIFNHPEMCIAYGIFEKENLIAWGAYRSGWDNFSSLEDGVFEISSVVVHSDHRRKGLGNKLLLKLLEEIKKNQKYKKIYLTVSPKNTGALLLYLKNGFDIYDFKKNVYGENAHRLYLVKE